MAAPSLGSWIERRAHVAPADVALVHGDERITYGQLATRVRETAALLQSLGVQRGDRVAFHGHNEPAALETLFASASLGAVWVPIHPSRPESDVRFILADAGVSATVRGRADCSPAGGGRIVSARELAAARAGRVVREPGTDVALEDLAILGYTSGTTGSPKGVMLSHANLCWNVVHMLSTCAFSRADVALAAAPFTRVGGIGVTVLETMFVGGSVVIPTALDAGAMLAIIARERVTVLFANPDLLQSLVALPAWPAADLSSIRTAIVGGGLVPEGLLRRYFERGIPLQHGYGLTEAAPVVTILDQREAMTRPRSVGKAIGFVEARVVGKDGAPRASGEVGELAIRGPNVTSGYWRNPGATAAARLPDGWWRTGDAAWMDAEGYVTLLDRVSEAIELAEGAVYPSELELPLYGAPGIADAAALSVNGALVLAVAPDSPGALNAEDVRARLRAHLPAWKLPASVRAVARIPRNASGKIIRRQLRDELEQGPAQR